MLRTKKKCFSCPLAYAKDQNTTGTKKSLGSKQEAISYYCQRATHLACNVVTNSAHVAGTNHLICIVLGIYISSRNVYRSVCGNQGMQPLICVLLSGNKESLKILFTTLSRFLTRLSLSDAKRKDRWSKQRFDWCFK